LLYPAELQAHIRTAACYTVLSLERLG